MEADIKLNSNQHEAVEWGEGPLLVLAGPGSGKTLVLTTRIGRLIQESPQGRFGVLGLSFTTQAADEMRKRVAGMLGREDRRTRLTTFHSFATKALRQHGSHLGLRPDFRLLSDADRVRMVAAAGRAEGIRNVPDSDDGLRRLMRTIDNLYQEGWDWEESIDQFPLRGAARERTAPIYSAYVSYLLRNNYLDFGALLVCCVRLFREHPRIAAFYRQVYPFACVDEYQDTNRAQDLIIRTIYPKQSNLFVVADDDQTIFQWNGADVGRIWQLAQDYSMKVIQLPESYRCPARVVRLATNLIQHRPLSESTQLVVKEPMTAFSVRGEAGDVVKKAFKDEGDETDWIARDIVDRSLNPGDCVVLARRRKLAEAAADALVRAGLDPYLGVRKDEFSSALVGFAHVALKLASAPNDGGPLERLCDAFAALTGQRIRTEDVEAERNASGGGLLNGFVDAATVEASESARSILRLLQEHLLNAVDYQAFVRATFRWKPSEADSFKRVADAGEEEEERQVWREIEKKARSRLGTTPTLDQLLEEFGMRPKTASPTRRHVQCLTIHGAKGKQFEHVYLMGLAEGELPSYNAVRCDDGSVAGRRVMDEERRSCFVAITRASSSVTLTHAESYFGWPKKPSRFFAEMELVGGSETASPSTESGSPEQGKRTGR